MNLGDIFNSVKSSVRSVAKPISDYFTNEISYTVPQAEAQSTTSIKSMLPAIKVVRPERIATAIRHLESSDGTDPNTPRNQDRYYDIPAANGNEAVRRIKYNSGYGGEYGLTPAALAHLAASTVDRNADPSTFTKFGRPLITGMSPGEIQKELQTPEGAGRLAHKFFIAKRSKKDDFTPEALAQDYIDNYVGKGGPSDTPQNRKRALEYFMSIAE